MSSKLNHGGYLIMITFDSTTYADVVTTYEKNGYKLVDDQVEGRSVQVSDIGNGQVIKFQYFRMRYS